MRYALALTVCLLCLFAAPVRADVTRIAWHTVAGCPDAARVQALASELAPHLQVAAPAAYAVRIERLPSRRFLAHISRTGDAAPPRSIEDADCTRLARAALLVVAVASDPLGLAAALAAPDAERTLLTLAAQTLLDVGSLPRVGAGLGVELGLQLRRARFEVSTSALLPRANEPGVEVSLYSGLARGCGELSVWQLRLGACAAAELGLTTGRGVGVSAARRAHGWWSAGWLGLSLQPRAAQRFSPALRLELGTPFERPSFEVAGQGRVFRAERVLFRAALTMRLSFL